MLNDEVKETNEQKNKEQGMSNVEGNGDCVK